MHEYLVGADDDDSVSLVGVFDHEGGGPLRLLTETVGRDDLDRMAADSELRDIDHEVAVRVRFVSNPDAVEANDQGQPRHLLVVYFQGNGVYAADEDVRGNVPFDDRGQILAFLLDIEEQHSDEHTHNHQPCEEQ